MKGEIKQELPNHAKFSTLEAVALCSEWQEHTAKRWKLVEFVRAACNMLKCVPV